MAYLLEAKPFLHIDYFNFKLKYGLQFNTKTAKHLFCKHCGISSYYVPRSNPDGVAVTLNCIDDFQNLNVTYQSCDGQNWEQSVGDSLREMSKRFWESKRF